jgi:hypothetical protein
MAVVSDIMKAALAAAGARKNAVVGSAETLAAMDAAQVVNFDENVWDEDDQFTLPKTREEVLPFLVTDTLENLVITSGENAGKHPQAHSVLVEVTNTRTKKTSVKRFRPNAMAQSIPMYKWDEAQQAYMATGENLGPNNELSQAISLILSQGQRLDYVLGKTLRVKRLIPGDVARYQKGVLVGIRRRYVPEFEIVK